MGAYGWWNWGRVVTTTCPSPGPRGAGTGYSWSSVLRAPCCWPGCWACSRRPVSWADGFVTAFSLLATWLLARKHLANWAYWIVADVVAVYLTCGSASTGTRGSTWCTWDSPSPDWCAGSGSGRPVRPEGKIAVFALQRRS